MKRLQRLALIGNHLPRRCGIATFTHDLHAAIATPRPALETCIVAMSDAGLTYDYPERVRFKVRDDQIEDYVRAADFLKEGRFEAVSLQHEYGIFGGEAGANIIALLSRLDVPVITTLHTVLPYPSAPQERVMRQILDMSERVVVMSAKGARTPVGRARGSGLQDRDHSARHSRSAVRRNAPCQSEMRFCRQDGHSDIRFALSQQRHRDDDRRHA